MMLVKPGGAGVEGILVGFACAPDSTKVEDELEGCEGVMAPCLHKEKDDLGGGCAGDDLEKEIDARIRGRREGSGLVLGEGKQGIAAPRGHRWKLEDMVNAASCDEDETSERADKRSG